MQPNNKRDCKLFVLTSDCLKHDPVDVPVFQKPNNCVSPSTITDYIRCLRQRRSIYTISQDRQCTYDVPLWGFHVTTVAVETQRCIFVFPHKLINCETFGNKFIEHKMYVSIFSTILPEIFLILKIIDREIIINLHRSLCIVPVILVRFQSNLHFLDIWQIPKYKIL
jgi:hypothetical protein